MARGKTAVLQRWFVCGDYLSGEEAWKKCLRLRLRFLWLVIDPNARNLVVAINQFQFDIAGRMYPDTDCGKSVGVIGGDPCLAFFVDTHTDCRGSILSQHAEERRIFWIQSKAEATGYSVVTKKLNQRQAMSWIRG